MENKYSACFFLSLQKLEYSTRCLSVMLIVTFFSSSNIFCDCLFPSSDKCFPLVIQLFVAVNFFFKLRDYKTAIILKSIFFLIYFLLGFHAEPLQSETANNLLSLVLQTGCAGGIGVSRASGCWVGSKELHQAEQFFPASPCAGGGKIGGGLCLFLLFKFLFVFPRDRIVIIFSRM